MSMGDEREPDQSTKLKQAIDILSSICSSSTSGTTSSDTSGGSSASRGGSQRHPDRSRARGTGKLLCNWNVAFNVVQYVWSTFFNACTCVAVPFHHMARLISEFGHTSNSCSL